MDDHTYSREGSQKSPDRINILSHISLDGNPDLQEANFSKIRKEFLTEHNLEDNQSVEEQQDVNLSDYTEDCKGFQKETDQSEVANGAYNEHATLMKSDLRSEEAYNGIVQEACAESDVERYQENGEESDNLQTHQPNTEDLKEEAQESQQTQHHEQTAGEAIETQMQLMEYIYEQDDDNARDVDGMQEDGTAQIANAEDYQMVNWQDTNSQELGDTTCNLNEESNTLQITDQSSVDYSLDDGSKHVNMVNEEDEETQLQIIGHHEQPQEYTLVEATPAVKPKVSKKNKKGTIKMFRCTICQFETRHETRLVDHFNEKHDIITKLYRCSHCGDETRKRLAIKKVINRRQRNPTVYRCRYCEYVSNERSYLQAHIHHRHNTDLFVCVFCKYSSPALDDLSKHFTLNHYYRNDTFRCSECGYQATADVRLSAHYADVHDICVELLKWSQQLIGVKCKCIANVENCERTQQGEVCTDNQIEVFKCYACGEETRFKPYKPYQTISVPAADLAYTVKAKPQTHQIVREVVQEVQHVQTPPQSIPVVRKVASLPRRQPKSPIKQVTQVRRSEPPARRQTYTNMKCCKCDFCPRDEEELVKHYQDAHIMVLDRGAGTAGAAARGPRRRSSGEPVKRKAPPVRHQLELSVGKRAALDSGAAEEKFGCSNCGFRTRLRMQLVNHLLYCKQSKTFSCGQCSYVTDCAAEVVEHTRDVHGELTEITDIDTDEQLDDQDLDDDGGVLLVEQQQQHGQTAEENMKAVESITELGQVEGALSTEDLTAELSCMQCSFKAHDEDQLITHIRTRHVLSFRLQKNANEFQITN